MGWMPVFLAIYLRGNDDKLTNRGKPFQTMIDPAILGHLFSSRRLLAALWIGLWQTVRTRQLSFKSRGKQGFSVLESVGYGSNFIKTLRTRANPIDFGSQGFSSFCSSPEASVFFGSGRVWHQGRRTCVSHWRLGILDGERLRAAWPKGSSGGNLLCKFWPMPISSYSPISMCLNVICICIVHMYR
jgi:hypothetical protein